MSENPILYRFVNDEITALDALEKVLALPSAPVVLAYTPARCCFARFKDGKIMPLERDINADDIFELRCFCEDYELRWVREGSKTTGKAVLASDSQHDLVGFSLEKIPYAFARADQYLLWGKKKDVQEGETVLFDHRIGYLRVPIKAQEERVYLCFKEYFRQDGYGNFALKMERCLALKS